MSMQSHIVVWVIFALAMFASADCVAQVTPAEARAIAKEAYVYGFPMVDNLRVQYAYFVDKGNPEYKAPYNQLFNIPRVYTHEDRAIQRPNSDTPYSWIGLDLRVEPIVFTVPPIEKTRSWSLQLIDLYTHNFDYLGTRTTGNDGGSFMIAGPSWKGETPQGIKKVIRCETEIASAQFRTQLFNPGDLDNVKQIQAQYIVKPLSAFLGQPTPKAAPAIDFPKALTPDAQKTSLEFFRILNFGLQFCPMPPSEKDLMARFARIGVGAGKTFDPDTLSPEMKKAIESGMADAWAEALYPAYFVDADGKQPTGANRYTLRFAPGQLPPVDALLVADDVRRSGGPARRQPAQPLPAQLDDAPPVQARCRRRTDTVDPARIPGRRPGSELAARAEGAVRHDPAPLSAEGRSARCHVETAAAAAGAIAALAARITRAIRAMASIQGATNIGRFHPSPGNREQAVLPNSLVWTPA